MVLPLLAVAGLSAGLSALGGIGQKNATARANRINAINEAMANERNRIAKEKADTENAARVLATDTANKAAIAKTNKINKKLAKNLGDALLNTPLVENRTTKTTGGVHSYSSQDNYSYVDTAAMMKAADAAGFNPVTFINAGGLQAYTQTGFKSEQHDISDLMVEENYSSTGHNAAAAYQLKAGLMSPQTYQATAFQTSAFQENMPTPQQAVPNNMMIAANAGSAALNAYTAGAAREDSQAFQREMLNTQLAAIQRNQGANRTGFVPSTVTSGGLTVGNKNGAGLSALSPVTSQGLPLPQGWKAGETEATTDMWKGILPWSSGGAKEMPDASVGENRYGELGEWLLGAANLTSDAFKAATGKSPYEWGITTKKYIPPSAIVGGLSDLGNKAIPWLDAIGRPIYNYIPGAK